VKLSDQEITVPILFIVYNRPDISKHSLNALAVVRPRTLLVAADGPKSPEDARLCGLTRKLIDEVKWPCDIRKNSTDKNLGCGIRVYSAIEWAMEQFEELIILEDDCIASPSFFGYCQGMLEYYRYDERVMHVSGNNFQKKTDSTKYSYYFSKYTHAWGWATWRRAWKYFDWTMARWPECRDAGILRNWCDDPCEQRYWLKVFEEMHGGRRDVWDYQWNFACWAQNGLAVLPSVNLVSNIGYGEDATHTKHISPYLERSTGDIHSLVHSPVIVRHVEADAFTFDNNFGGAAMKYSQTWRAKYRGAFHLLSLPYRALRKLCRAAWNPATGLSRH